MGASRVQMVLEWENSSLPMKLIVGSGAAASECHGKSCIFGYVEFYYLSVCQVGLDARLGGRR